MNDYNLRYYDFPSNLQFKDNDEFLHFIISIKNEEEKKKDEDNPNRTSSLSVGSFQEISKEVQKFDSVHSNDPFIRIQLLNDTISHIMLRCPMNTSVYLIKQVILENLTQKRVKESFSITENNIELSLQEHSTKVIDFLDNDTNIMSYFERGVTVMIVFCNIIQDVVNTSSNRKLSLTQNQNNEDLIVRKTTRQARTRRNNRRKNRSISSSNQ